MNSTVTRVSFSDMNELRVHKSVTETQMGHNMDKSPKYKLNPEIG